MDTKPKHSTDLSIQNREPHIVIQGLCKRFGNNVVLDRFDLTVYKKENLVVLGKSGSGKSVLIKCIVGLIPPDSGTITLNGESMVGLNYEALDKMRTKIGFLFQGNAIYDSMTVGENLEFPLRRKWIKKSQEEIDSLIIEALDNVGLKHTREMMPAELSGGMLKRVALARTMILKPQVILYDEPTAGLDPVTAREIENLILRFRDKYNITSIVISHDMNCVKKLANRIVLILNGKCYAEGTYKEFRHSEDENIKQFFE